MFVKLSLSGSPPAPSFPLADVGSRLFAYSQPSGMPSLSESQPSGSSSLTPSPSSSLLPQMASPSLSESAESRKPSPSLSIPSLQISPNGSSSHRTTVPLAPSAPAAPQAGVFNVCTCSSDQSLTGMVPFHQTPLSRTAGVAVESQLLGILILYSCKLMRPSPSGSPVAPLFPEVEASNGSRPYFHSQPSGKPSPSVSGSAGWVLRRYS